MVLTPPDPVSQIIMAVPMCILYELCIWVIRLRELAKGKKDEPAAVT
jgi:sec-independent protein translocase protein TatC